MIESLERAAEAGSIRARSLCEHALGAVDYLLGDWESSEQALQASVEKAREVGSTFGEVLGQQRIAIVETATGRMSQAHERLTEALEIANKSDSPMVQVHSMTRLYGALAQNRLDVGDVQAANRYLERGFRVQRAVGKCVPCDVLMYPAAVPLYIAIGDLEKADWACAQLEDAANGFVSRAWIAQARYLRGVMLGESQEWERSKSILREALSIYRDLEQPYESAQVAQALGEVILRGGSISGDEDAESLLKEAYETYSTLGSHIRRDAVGQLLKELVV